MQVLHTRGFTGTGLPFLQLVAACMLLFGGQQDTLGAALAALHPLRAVRESPALQLAAARRHRLCVPPYQR